MNARDVPWKQLLEHAAERVQLSVSAISRSDERARVVGKGASGDDTLLADREAEEELRRALSRIDELEVLSEEAGNTGDSKASVRAVIDPLDGSTNFARGIPFYCTSVAIAEGKGLRDVRFGFVRNLVNGDVYEARKGGGATKNGSRIRTSSSTEPSESVVAIDMSRASEKLVADLAPLVAGVKRQVHYGANALELCYVAEGRVDAFVDIRDRMRITDFAAAWLIASEAGALITGASGSVLDPAFDLGARFSFVASANASLHEKILGLCGRAARRQR